MSGWVVRPDGMIETLRDDLVATNQHCTDRHFACRTRFLSGGLGQLHEVEIAFREGDWDSLRFVGRCSVASRSRFAAAGTGTGAGWKIVCGAGRDFASGKLERIG